MKWKKSQVSSTCKGLCLASIDLQVASYSHTSHTIITIARAGSGTLGMLLKK